MHHYLFSTTTLCNAVTFYAYGHDAAILDEPLQQLKPVRVINADITDLLAQWL